LKNSFQGTFNKEVVRKLLNIRLPQALELAEITALVPFSTATPVCNNYRSYNLQRERINRRWTSGVVSNHVAAQIPTLLDSDARRR